MKTTTILIVEDDALPRAKTAEPFGRILKRVGLISLAAAQRIIHRRDGALRAKDAVGQGAAFFSLPSESENEARL